MKKLSLSLFAAALLSLSLSACEDSMMGAQRMAHSIGGPLAGLASRRDYPIPVEQMSYAPNDPQYVRYVNGFSGTDTHKFETGDRSFVMRGTPPLSGIIEPWYDWNDIGTVNSKPISFNDCGKCNLAMGAEADIMTQNLKGHTVNLEICYYKTKKIESPMCFKGDTLKLGTDVHKWQKMTVTVPFEKFRTIAYKNARIRLSVDEGEQRSGKDRMGKAGFEGVIWADNFRFQLAEQNGTDAYNVKLSGALWPDDYAGWDTGMGKPREGLQAWKQ